MPALEPLAAIYVGWMTPFSSTIGAIGEWLKRHPLYDADERLR